MTTSDVTVRLRDNLGECQGNRDKCTLKDLCPKYGTLLKPNRDGNQRVRGCGDNVYRGKLSKSRGGRSQRKTAKLLGIQRNSIATGHEEHEQGALRRENKAGKQVQPIITRYLAAEAQSEAARPMGDIRPFLMTCEYEGVTLGIFRLDHAGDIAQAIAENLGSP